MIRVKKLITIAAQRKTGKRCLCFTARIVLNSGQMVQGCVDGSKTAKSSHIQPGFIVLQSIDL